VVMWQDVARELRQAIDRGDYPYGTLIPKETELMAEHHVGRETVRRAVAQLTAEGILEPRRRRGTAVRARPTRQRITRSRMVFRDQLGYYFDSVAQPWRPLRTPIVSRGPVPYDVAELLDLEPGAEAVIRDRLMGDPATGEPAQLATSYIPAALATELPVLAEADTGPGGIYDRLEDAGHGPIRWDEAITARMPGPDEGHLLRLPPGVPLLRIIRLAVSSAGRPLEVNDTRLDAERWEVGYPITRYAPASLLGRSARPELLRTGTEPPDYLADADPGTLQPPVDIEQERGGRHPVRRDAHRARQPRDFRERLRVPVGGVFVQPHVARHRDAAAAPARDTPGQPLVGSARERVRDVGCPAGPGRRRPPRRVTGVTLRAKTSDEQA
jgi:DNA-binding GntR family transcriptional regulator